MTVKSSDNLDDLLDRAVLAVRDADVPDGPTPFVAARTRQAIQNALASSAGRRAVRWAAAILVCGSVAAAAVVGRQLMNDKPVATVTPPKKTEPSPKPADRGGVVGVVVLDGPAPLPSMLPPLRGIPDCGHHHAPPADESIVVANAGGVANVVVSVSHGLPTTDETEFDAPPTPAVLDQKDCKYFPRVVTMQVGQALVAKNSDPFFHSVHTNSRINNPVLIGQPTLDPVGIRLKRVKEAETFKVTCDQHPWMTAWVAAFDHPYHAVTAADGSFHMPALKPGTYTIRAWHERLGAVDQQVTVAADGKLPPLKLHFGQDRLAAALADRIPTADAGDAVKPPCCVEKR